MQFGLDVPTTADYADPRLLAQLAVDAEAAGWHGFFIWDVLDGVDPWIALTAIALATTRIRIGTMVLPLARHQPWLVAKRLAELDHLSGGRVVCTVGLGDRAEVFSQVGANPDPRVRAAQLDEGLAVLQQVWTTADASYHGQHYRLDRATITPRPLQTPHLPVWVAGGWPRRAPFRRAARWDGISFKSINADSRAWLSIAEFEAGVAYVRQQRSIRSPFDVVMSGDTSGARDTARAKVQAFSRAGATWWVEEGFGWTYADFRDHIRLGPPHA